MAQRNMLLARTEGKLVAAARNPLDINVSRVMSTLGSVKTKVTDVHTNVTKIVADVHRDIERFNKQIVEGKGILDTKLLDLERCAERVRTLKERQAECVANAVQARNRAVEFLNSTQREKSNAVAKGMVGGIGVAGVLLAPFTFGSSLAVTAAVTGVSGGVAALGIAGTIGSVQQADRYQGLANTYERQMREAITEIEQKEKDCNEIKEEIVKILESLDELCKKTIQLEFIRAVAFLLIKLLSEAGDGFQDIDNCLYKTIQETDAFGLIQEAFREDPENMSEIAHGHFKELKEQFAVLESVFNQPGGQRSLTH